MYCMWQENNNKFARLLYDKCTVLNINTVYSHHLSLLLLSLWTSFLLLFTIIYFIAIELLLLFIIMINKWMSSCKIDTSKPIGQAFVSMWMWPILLYFIMRRVPMLLFFIVVISVGDFMYISVLIYHIGRVYFLWHKSEGMAQKNQSLFLFFSYTRLFYNVWSASVLNSFSLY